MEAPHTTVAERLRRPIEARKRNRQLELVATTIISSEYGAEIEERMDYPGLEALNDSESDIEQIAWARNAWDEAYAAIFASRQLGLVENARDELGIIAYSYAFSIEVPKSKKSIPDRQFVRISAIKESDTEEVLQSEDDDMITGLSFTACGIELGRVHESEPPAGYDEVARVVPPHASEYDQFCIAPPNSTQPKELSIVRSAAQFEYHAGVLCGYVSLRLQDFLDQAENGGVEGL